MNQSVMLLMYLKGNSPILNRDLLCVCHMLMPKLPFIYERISQSEAARSLVVFPRSPLSIIVGSLAAFVFSLVP